MIFVRCYSPKVLTYVNYSAHLKGTSDILGEVRSTMHLLIFVGRHLKTSSPPRSHTKVTH